jgi:hypothetical protein
MRRVVAVLLPVLLATTITCAPRPPAPEADSWPPVATFSILAYDPETGEIGGAVQSRVFSVGNGVLWSEAGVGAVASPARRSSSG